MECHFPVRVGRSEDFGPGGSRHGHPWRSTGSDGCVRRSSSGLQQKSIVRQVPKQPNVSFYTVARSEEESVGAGGRVRPDTVGVETPDVTPPRVY